LPHLRFQAAQIHCGPYSSVGVWPVRFG
jgi:hypothetical protein